MVSIIRYSAFLIPITVLTATATKFTVKLSDDLYTLSATRRYRPAHSYQKLLDVLTEQSWQLRPLWPMLAVSEETMRVNNYSEVESSQFYSNDDISLLKKHGIHRLYELRTMDDDVSLDDVRDHLAKTSIVEYVTSSVTPPVMPSLLGEEDLDLLNNQSRVEYVEYVTPNSADHEALERVPATRGTPRDYSNCKTYPCQGYLYLDETPSQYKLVGNNVVKTWEDYGVTGKGTRLIVVDTGVIDLTPHKEISTKRQVIGKGSTTAQSHKTMTAGVILAKHNNLYVEGIAPDVEAVLDFTCDFTDIITSWEKLYMAAQNGDVLVATWGTPLSKEMEKAIIESDPNVLYVQANTIIFDDVFNPMLNALTEKGVTSFVSVGNGGIDHSTTFWKTNFPVSEREEQTAALVVAWDPLTGEPHESASYMKKLDKKFMNIQFGNWGSDVVTLDNTSSGINTNFVGSSAAAPITAGAGLLVQSAAKQYLKKFLTPKKVIDVLFATGMDLSNKTQKYKDFSQTRMPDVYEAVKSVVGKPPTAKSSSTTKAPTTKKTTTKTKKTTGKAATTKKTTTKTKNTTKANTTKKVVTTKSK